MKKKWLYIIIVVIGVPLAGIVIPMFGLPSSKQVLIRRIERLENWKDGVKYYIQDNNRIPSSLLEVYKYCNENKKDIDLRLIIMPYPQIEQAMIETDKILDDENKFVKKIDYEFISTERNWFVREKKAYPRFFRERGFLAIDSRGNIYANPLEELGVTTKKSLDGKSQ